MSVVNFFPLWISTCFSTIYQRELFHVKFYWHLCWTSSIWALYSDSLIYEFIIILNRKFAVSTSVVFLMSLEIFEYISSNFFFVKIISTISGSFLYIYFKNQFTNIYKTDAASIWLGGGAAREVDCNQQLNSIGSYTWAFT